VVRFLADVAKIVYDELVQLGDSTTYEIRFGCVSYAESGLIALQSKLSETPDFKVERLEDFH
jgi:hypothetical protein